VLDYCYLEVEAICFVELSVSSSPPDFPAGEMDRNTLVRAVLSYVVAALVLSGGQAPLVLLIPVNKEVSGESRRIYNSSHH